MIEFLNEVFVWWHWVVFGIALFIMEMTTGTFIMLGLGAAAIVVGIIDLLIGTTFTTELTIWMILSVVAIGAWFKWLRDKSITKSGQSNYRLNTLGITTEAIEPHRRGKVTFDTPVLGNSSWPATAKVSIPKDTRVQILEINGQLIEVEPITP